MRTVLHIGMPKTGSTALQGCLRASAKPLAAAGILYPRNPKGCLFNNHRMLIFGYTPFSRLPRHVRRYEEYTAANYREKYQEFLDVIARQVDRRRPEVLVLSSESLFRQHGGRARAELRAALGRVGGEVVVAAYLRRPSEYYLSNLQQRLRNSYEIGPLWVPPLHGVLRAYARIFGPAAVRPRLFAREALRDGDVISDFLHAYLPDHPVDMTELSRGPNSNETVSAEAMDLLRRYRLAFHRDTDNVLKPDSAQLVRLLRRLGEEAGAGKPRLHPHIADLLDYRRRDPLLVRDEYGIVFRDFDYRRLERRTPFLLPAWVARLRGARSRLGDLVPIDRDLQRALLAGVAASDWAREAPERRAWAEALARDPQG